MRCVLVMAAGVVIACTAPERRTDTVLLASGADLQSANPLVTVHPLAKQVQKYVLFTTLARYDQDLVPRPYLALDWEWAQDRSSATFRIATDVRWHDGHPTTAHDVEWTYRTAADSRIGYPRAASLRIIESVEAVDSFTVRVAFREPLDRLPDVFTDLPILPAHLLDGTAPSAMRSIPFNSAPIGNGPFRFVRREPNRRWVFERNGAFPAALGGPPRLRRFVVSIVDEASTKLAALAARELDVAGINPAHAAFVQQTDYLRVVDYPVLFTTMLIFNTRRPPFDDVRVRRAVSLALDREALVTSYVYGFGDPATGPIPSGHPARPDEAPSPRNLDEGRALLARAGFDAARPLEFDLLATSTGENPLELLIQAQLAELGARVRVRPMELGAFLASAQGADRDFDALTMGVPGDLELGHLRGLFHSSHQGDPLHYAGYASREMDAALDGGHWAEVSRLLRRDAPVALLYHARGVQGISRRLRGVVMDVRGELPTVAEWALDDARP